MERQSWVRQFSAGRGMAWKGFQRLGGDGNGMAGPGPSRRGRVGHGEVP